MATFYGSSSEVKTYIDEFIANPKNLTTSYSEDKLYGYYGSTSAIGVYGNGVIGYVDYAAYWFVPTKEECKSNEYEVELI